MLLKLYLVRDKFLDQRISEPEGSLKLLLIIMTVKMNIVIIIIVTARIVLY